MKKSLLYFAAALILTAAFAACTAEITTLPTGVSLDQIAVMLPPGESITLTADVFPDEAAIKTLIWSSSNPAVATVADGVVNAITEGVATITVTTKSGQKSTTCEVTVTYPVFGVTLDKASASLPVGQNMRLMATVKPDDAPDQTITWESSNPDIATVSDGLVTAIAPGKATITVITEVGHRIATCSVRVLSDKYMTLTTSNENNVRLTLLGSGTAEIDWGDGSAFETYTLSTSHTGLSHIYSQMLSCNITIEGGEITYLNCSDIQLTSLDVSKITTLTNLICFSNMLTSLDVSNNIALTSLNCSNNMLKILEVNNNTNLTELLCIGNQLTNLNVSNKTALRTLSCSSNQITGLDVSNNSELYYLDCSYNQLSDLNMSSLFALKNLYCNENQLSGLDVSNNTALTYLACNNNQLTSLDVSKNTELTGLSFQNNPLNSLEVSDTKIRTLTVGGIDKMDHLVVNNNSVLTQLTCSSIRLNNLVVSNNPALTNIDCSLNELSHIDVSSNAALTSLNCASNSLTSLDVSSNTALQILDCRRNDLANMAVSRNGLLTSLNCSSNELSVSSLDDLFEMLPIVGSASFLNFRYNPGTADCNSSIAENKGWISPKMLLTLQGSGDFWLGLGGYGEIEIEWGDGMITSDYLSGISYFSHTFSEITSYTIIIYGASIEFLNCYNFRLTNLDVSKNPALTELYCGNNQLTNLDISMNPALTRLDCQNNQLTSLDVSKNINLGFLNCQSNQLSTNALNALFETLPNRNFPSGDLRINNNPGTNTCDRSIATNKNWRFN